MKNKTSLFIVTFFIFTMTNCVRHLAVNLSKPIIANVERQFMKESDLELAAEALPPLIKIAEGMESYNPNNPFYSGKLCYLLSAYTFAFLDEAPYSDFDVDSENKLQQMNQLYKRAYGAGMRAMNKQIKNFEITLLTNPQLVIKKIKKEQVETVFWLTFSWAMLIFNNTHDTSMVIHLDKVKMLADRLKELDSDFLYGAIFAIDIAYYGGRRDSIGGNYKKSLKALNKSQKRYGRDSLIPLFVYLKFVSTQRADSELFDKTYRQLESFELNKNKEILFLNKIIKSKAKTLYDKKEDLF